MANYWLDNGMALMRQREIDETTRYGTPNGSKQQYGTVTYYRNGNPVSSWNSSSDTETRTSGSYFCNGFYNR